jgi:equilibrative nucleoside transporter 1/2/3
MSGQAAVAVAVSGVQVFSAVASVWGQSPETIASYVSDGEPEERSALVFFGLSTVFLVVSAAANGWLVTMPAYKTVAGSLEHKKVVGENVSSDELRGLVSSGRNELSDEKGQILRVARANGQCSLKGAVHCAKIVQSLSRLRSPTSSLSHW